MLQRMGGRMISPSLKDNFGRTIKDLRISVTDRCNFRCFYCIPDENIVWKRKQELLTYDEVVLVCEIAVGLGVKKRAFTLRSAGLNRITISCDSLKPETFKAITKRDALQSVLDGIEATILAGFPPPKINCVVIRE